MERPPSWYIVSWVRILLVLVGVSLAVGFVAHALTVTPTGPPPEDSDGFGEGLSVVAIGFSVVVATLGLAVAGSALALPLLSDRPSFAGFGRRGRIVLLGAGVALGAAVGVLPQFGPVDVLEEGLLLLIVTAIVAVPLLVVLGVRRLLVSRSGTSSEPVD